MYKLTTATSKILGLTKRIRAVSGGTSASKTISILLWFIDRAQSIKITDEREVLSIVSETMPQLRKGAMRDFLDIMEQHGYYNEKYWNKTDSIYTFNNAIIEFFSADQSERVKGPRRDWLFINEANNVHFETFNQLEVRTKKGVFLDWNPVSEFWFYTELKDKRPDLDFITLTYLDNEALDKSIIDSLELRRNNKNWWKVYGEGQLGEAEGRIYTGWNIDMETIPPEAKLVRYGMDFGYTNDPTAIVAIYKWNDAFILDEVCYMKGLSNKNIADIMLGRERKLIYADSAEPKSIEEIKGYGLLIIPAKKGKDSVNQGIQYVQEQKIFVTKRSTNLIKEYRNYLWLTDTDGKSINEPQDFLNHALDAVRYGMDNYKAPQTNRIMQQVGGMNSFYPGLPG